MAFPRTHHKVLSLMTGTALAAGLLTSPAAAVAQAAEHPGDALHWGPCPKDVLNNPAYHVQCTTFKVPLDYRKPGDKKITIMMSRIKATGHSRGIILNNPGGPGGSALNMWSWMVPTDAGPLHKHFDLISVQPRGLQHATPLKSCVEPTVPEIDSPKRDEKKNPQKAFAGAKEKATKAVSKFQRLVGNVDPKDTATKAKEKAQAEYERCVKDYQTLFDQVTTENTVRDFDMARQYLGEQKINYYGASYGTWLDAVYATIFPEHTGRFVLDSAVDPSGIWTNDFGNQGDMQRRRMYEMFDFIAAHDDLYHLGDTPLKVYTKWYRIIEKEMHGPGTPRLSAPPAQIGDVPPEFRHNVQLYLKGYNLARPVADRIERAIRAWQVPSTKQEHNLWELTGAAFVSRSVWPVVAAYMQKPRPKPLTKEEKDEQVISANVFMAVTCNEDAVKPSPANLPATVAAYFSGEDFFTLKNLIVTSGMMCPGIAPTTTPVQVTGEYLTIRPVVLQSVNDTQTPYSGGVKMANAMNAYFVKTEGGDHGVYVRHNPAAWKLVNDYYLKDPVVTRTSLPYATVEKMVVKLDTQK